jgi:hypothetical protein
VRRLTIRRTGGPVLIWIKGQAAPLCDGSPTWKGAIDDASTPLGNTVGTSEAGDARATGHEEIGERRGPAPLGLLTELGSWL